MSNRIDIGNVRGIRGEKGEKGEKGSTPSYDDIKYEKRNGNYVTLVTDGTISKTEYYLDANRQLCNNEGYLIDDEGNVTGEKGIPYDISQYGYEYEPLYVDNKGRYTNSKGELLDDDYKVQYVESTFLQDILNHLFKDGKKWTELVTSVSPLVVDTLVSADPTDSKYYNFFQEIEGDIKYYVCNNNPRTNIYINNDDELVNTCKYYNDNGLIVMDENNQYVPVPLEKNTLYLYNPSNYTDNDIMHYDIYVCLKYNTVPIKLVSASDFAVSYNVLDDVTLDVRNNNVTEENDVFLITSLRGTGRVYTVEDVDQLFDNNVISKLGANNGIAQLNSSGKVPNSQLPAYVDDVIEGTMNSAETKFTPSDNDYIDSVKQTGKIYVDTSTRKTYRWSGSSYIFISNPIIVDDGGTNAYASSSGQALETLIGDSTLTTTDKTVTGAINEHESDINSLVNDKQDKNEPNLNTEQKTILGAINELYQRKSENNHGHGYLSNDGKIVRTEISPKQVVVSDNNHELGIVSKLPLDLVTHQDISGKVDKVDGMDLSSNDYTDEEKAKLGRLKEIQIINDESEVDGDGIFFLIDENLNYYTISLSSDKDIIQSGEVATLSALLKKNNVVLGNETIVFEVDGDEFESVTDSNGVATFSYTGSGLGEVEISVSFNTLLQETYEIYDCIKCDVGTIANHNDSLWSSIAQLTRSNDGTRYYADRTSESTVYQIVTSQIPIDNGVRFEFEVYDVANNQSTYLQSGRYTTGESTIYHNISIDTDAVYTIDFLPNTTIFYKDNAIVLSVNDSNNESLRVFLRTLARNVGDFKYKNLKIYSI